MAEEGIKSAFERAWEKAERIAANADDGKVKELQYGPDGARLAARFLKEEKFDLNQELSQFPAEIRKYVTAGAVQTLESNIGLPRNERLRRDAGRALEGLLALKRDKSRVSVVKDKLQGMFAQYEQLRQNGYNSLRQEYDAMLRQAMQQQMGISTQMKIDVENHPEFRQRLQEFTVRLEQEFERRLQPLKEEIRKIN